MYGKFSSWAQIIIVMAAVILAGCESRWEKMPDEELAAKSSECLMVDDPGPAMIQVCKNYTRECERRRELGIYVC